MKKFWIVLSVCWLWTCSGGGDKATGPEEPPIVVNLTSLTGQAQKGPFNNGTSINVAELSNTLSPTGRNFSSAITDNTGRFSVANVQLESPFVELRATGFYFNEVSNNISDAQLTLYALSDLTNKSSLNVNILTHLEKNRMQVLMSGDTPKTFAQAKLQAQEEVLAIFDYSRANMPASELLDISQGGAANAKLLAISAILQGVQTVGKMSELLANISTDITADGTIENTTIRNTLINNAANLDFEQIRSNLVARFTALGITATIPDFETEINQFLKPPVAQDMSASTGEDTPINITLAASDPEGESLTFQIVETNNATVNINGNVANYTPNANFNGTDTFTYFANDGTVNSNTATVTITVGAVDDEPNTNDVATTTDEDTEVVFTLTADEYDGDSYSFALITQPSIGSASLDGSTVTYTPNANWNGTDTFTFEASDNTGRIRNVATATITVNPVNDAPFAPDMTIDMVEDGTGQFIISSAASDANFFRINATDIENDALTFQAISVNNATYVLVDNNNELAYYPNQDFNGQDTFQYTVSDGTEESNTGTITVNIAGVNDPPQALDITVDSIYEDTAHNFLFEEGMIGENTGGFTGIDVDNNPYSGQTLDFILVSQPSNGNLSIDGSTISIGDLLNDKSSSSELNILYTPNNNFYGTDSFTYKSNDGELDSNNVGTATITFVPVNDAPVTTDISATTYEDTSLLIHFEDGVNIIDIDNEIAQGEVTGSIVSLPANGNLYKWNGDDNTPDTTMLTVGDQLENSAGLIKAWYVPNSNFNGTDTFTYQASDGTDTSEEKTVEINIVSVKTFGGENFELANSVIQTSDGGYLIGGQTESFGDGGYDIYLVKTDASGTEEWSQTFGGENNDVATSVIQALDGGYLLAGSTRSFGNGSSDMYLVKTDANGTEEWFKTFGGTAYDYAYSIFQTSDGGYLIGGQTESFGNGSSDMYLVKTDASGNEEWSKTFGGENNDSAYSVIQTSDGGYLLGGRTESFGNGNNDMYLVKTDANGTEEWFKTFGGTANHYAYSILQTSDGGYLLGGVTNSFGNGEYDMHLVKTDASGTEEWSQTFGGENFELANSVIQTSDGGYLIGGQTESFGNRDSDMYLVKTDANGTEEWSQTYGGGSDDAAYSVIQTSDGGYLLAGSTRSFGSGDSDMYLVKTDSEGNQEW